MSSSTSSSDSGGGRRRPSPFAARKTAARPDFDSTLALLAADLPSVPNYPRDEDDSEEEVFFGERSAKETSGKHSRYDSENLPPTPPPPSTGRTSPAKSSSPTTKQVTFSRKPDVADLSEPFKELDLANRSPGKGDRPFRESIRSRSPLSSSGRISHEVTTVDESDDQSSADTSPLNIAISPDVGIGRRPSRSGHDESAESNFSLNSSTSSNWFNNTHDEMVLFEKFGEKYDEVVAGMSITEKRALKKEVSQMEAKSAHELLGVNALEDSEIFHEEEEEAKLEEKRMPVVAQPPTPKPRTMTPQKMREDKVEETPFSPRLVESQSALKMLRDELALALTPEPKTPTKEEEDKSLEKERTSSKMSPVTTPALSAVLKLLEKPISTKVGTPLKTAQPIRSDKVSTSAKTIEKVLIPSKLQYKTTTPSKLLNKATTPSKLTPSNTPSSRTKLLPASGSFKTPTGKTAFSYLRPTSASKHRASPKKDLVTNEALDVTICSRHGYAHTESPGSWQPERKKVPCAVNLAKVASPVAKYVREHPVPPLMRQVRPGKNRHMDEDALAAAIARERSPKRDVEEVTGNGVRFTALPEAVYKSSRVALEKEVSGDYDKKKALPKSFGKVENVEALVVRHVSRERVPAHLRPTEEELETVSRMSCDVSASPRPAILRLAQNRDSMAPDNESLLEMSIREVKKVTMGGGKN